jgi:hypothetical protein
MLGAPSKRISLRSSAGSFTLATLRSVFEFLFFGRVILDIAAFLACVYSGCSTGYLTIWTKQDKTTRYFDVSKLDTAAEYARERAQSGHDVYFGVGLRGQDFGPTARGKKSDVVTLPGIWLDIDIQGPGHKEAVLPTSIDEATAILDLCPMEPTLLVDSGGGLHVYWLFDRPLDVGTQHDHINAAFKTFEKRIRLKVLDKLGFKIDATANIDRVLRLPDTWNYKSDPARPVSVIFSELANRYKFTEMSVAAKALEARKTTGQTSEDFVVELKRRLRNLTNQENKALFSKILAGKPFAEEGERDTLLQRAAGCVAYVMSSEDALVADAEVLANIFDASIEKMRLDSDDPDNPALTREIAVDKISRALGDRSRTVNNDREIKSFFVLKREPDEQNQAATAATTPAATVSAAAQTTQQFGQYTPEQIIEWSTKEEVPPGGFTKRWIIQNNATFYVYVNGRYKSPVGKESLLTHLRDDLAPAESVGVMLNTWTAKGDVRPKTITEILHDYATGARHLKGSLCIQDSYYDRKSETFWEAVCSIRDIAPVFHPQIDHWLRLLGGEDHDKLLDWVATALLLDLQSSALYLSGHAGAGKTMLADGLGRLWTTSGPTLLENVADTSFNADIAKCPLIFGDEQVKCSTSELRRLVGSSSHTLKRKFLSNVDLEGALRIVLADNSGKLIHGDELGGADMDAVASKFLRIDVTREPVDYLRSLGGRAGTDGWVSRDKIAEHAMWLAINRNVVLGSRLAVEGEQTKMAQMIVVQDRTTGILCEWIARFIDHPLGSVLRAGAEIGGGKILVSAEAISKFWTSYVNTEKQVFSMTKIGRALNNLSAGKEVVSYVSGGVRSRRRLHSIRPELIYAWAEENLSCDMEEIQHKVANGITA